MQQPSHTHPLLVAMSLVANHDEHLLWFARDLSRRLHLPLKLVHACENESGNIGPLHWATKWLPKDLQFYIRGKLPSPSVSQAEKTLCEIARRLSLKSCGCVELPPDATKPDTSTLPKDAEVRTERPAGHALALAAEESKAAMILLGAKEPALWFNWSAANVREVLRVAPCPVLILRRDLSVDPSRERMVIILADDLTAATLGVVKTAFQLACRSGSAHILHVHVAPLGVPSESLAAISRELAARSAPHLSQLQHHLCTYQPIVAQGSAQSSILKIIRENDVDILVTGDGEKKPGSSPQDIAHKKSPSLPPSKWLAAPCALLVVPKSSHFL
jgi:nucleotide-binding universal stress UspA family protein